ncbi:hypothetical protein E2C01_020451 [Portunus trituberculatus]|uniref:Uncharacterized protein n=1 Tax=Portunus trituberculatus TaxID=210409 RepID=A0A5B7E231_PORTR|nr:hypothetical protein [Portunus trituberculatus]
MATGKRSVYKKKKKKKKGKGGLQFKGSRDDYNVKRDDAWTAKYGGNTDEGGAVRSVQILYMRTNSWSLGRRWSSP